MASVDNSDARDERAEAAIVWPQRLMDLAAAIAGLAVLSPLMMLIALAICIETGRPIFYSQTRIGRGGGRFRIHKFRKFYKEIGAGSPLTVDHDPRMTPFGRVLALTKLDELPQLWNVVRGEMSIVGPRPIRPRFFEELARDIPGYWQRLVVRPGITGFAQLRLTRNMTWAEKLAHDFEYIADRGVRLYLEIVAETAWLVISGRAPRDVP
jgi:lipopolysaccharide/colanic/teichoic acid biosynthesis glycosyltransferase